jgi:hypothetical protein
MTQAIQGGTQANYTGTVLEKFIQDRLIERGYAFIPNKKFDAAKYIEQPIYTRRYYVGLNIYESKLYCDFILYHPQKWPRSLIIESKWQQSGGSVDEKFPFLVLNIQYKYPCPTIILIDGGGYRKVAEAWLRNQAGTKNLEHVFSMSEFQKWVNQNYL